MDVNDAQSLVLLHIIESKNTIL